MRFDGIVGTAKALLATVLGGQRAEAALADDQLSIRGAETLRTLPGAQLVTLLRQPGTSVDDLHHAAESIRSDLEGLIDAQEAAEMPASVSGESEVGNGSWSEVTARRVAIALARAHCEMLAVLIEYVQVERGVSSGPVDRQNIPELTAWIDRLREGHTLANVYAEYLGLGTPEAALALDQLLHDGDLDQIRADHAQTAATLTTAPAAREMAGRLATQHQQFGVLCLVAVLHETYVHAAPGASVPSQPLRAMAMRSMH